MKKLFNNSVKGVLNYKWLFDVKESSFPKSNLKFFSRSSILNIKEIKQRSVSKITPKQKHADETNAKEVDKSEITASLSKFFRNNNINGNHSLNYLIAKNLPYDLASDNQIKNHISNANNIIKDNVDDLQETNIKNTNFSSLSLGLNPKYVLEKKTGKILVSSKSLEDSLNNIVIPTNRLKEKINQDILKKMQQSFISKYTSNKSSKKKEAPKTKTKIGILKPIIFIGQILIKPFSLIHSVLSAIIRSVFNIFSFGFKSLKKLAIKLRLKLLFKYGIFAALVIAYFYHHYIQTYGYEFQAQFFLKENGEKNSNNDDKRDIKPSFGNFGESIFSAEGKNKMTIKIEKNIDTSLQDVKGIDEVVEEIEQLIRVIKNPEKYRNAGAKIPKGVLLVGKPGTGKTLVAKAIAGDSKVNFISVSGSDFEEKYVGVGASRVKNLFATAKKNAPCIIFIDEIDSLLAKSKRTTNEHSSSRATINQFLTEMDGFNKLENIFILGATNHESDLDTAAVRPGRFDKKIHINVPNSKGREDIAEYYLNKILLPKNKDVTPSVISQMTSGFTGAELENLINLSGIFTINNKAQEMNLSVVTEARDRILMGISRKFVTDMNKRRFMTAVHEVGHTYACYKNPLCKPRILKVTVVPSGPALGVTQTLELDDTIENKEYYLSFVDMAMGGHTAEECIFGKDNVTAGCSSDLSKATQIAKKMIYEMSMYGDEIGYIYYDKGSEIKEEKLGEKHKIILNNKVDQILAESHDRVRSLINDNMEDVIKLSRALYKYNTLDANEIELVLNNKLDLIKRTEYRDDYSEENAEKRS